MRLRRPPRETLGPIAGLPGRHGASLPSARQVTALLRVLLRHPNPEPDAQQWRSLAQALTRGDPLADAVARWMKDAGLAHSMPMLEAALARGVDQVPAAPEVLKRFFAQVDTPPHWLDVNLLARGAQASNLAGLAGTDIMRDLALMAGYQSSAINRTLVLTGALSRGAQRRLAETTKWWVDCTTPGGMARFAPGFQGTVRVRLMHALVRQRVQHLPEWDAGWLGVPINQQDMQATYLGFCVVYLTGLRFLGVWLRRDEVHALMHLWRYIGWLMGVEDELLFDDFTQAQVGLYRNLLAQPAPDDSSRALGAALMNEPLHTPYGHRWTWLNGLRGRYERARHLSISRLFLTNPSMRSLGLPGHVLPWYPAMRLPWNLLVHETARRLPGGLDWLQGHGQRQQQDHLATMFGRQTARLGSVDEAGGMPVIPPRQAEPRKRTG
ncbi:oxygenase MpaB family protein [Aquabacterium lacunae]|nr:oxygenase MpaB family protein [Aquabacterium lacunae]